MSQVKKHIRIIASLAFAALFALNCARSSQSQFSKNMEADAGKPAPTYEEWVALVGQEKTDALYTGIGQDSLNLLSYGVGYSNMVQLINGVASAQKLVALIGNDFIAGNVGETGPGGMTGLGTLATLYLVKQVDVQMQVATSSNLLLPCSGVTPASCSTADTIGALKNIINTLTLTEIQQKLVYMFGPNGFNLKRNLSGTNDTMFVGRMARVVAHVWTVDTTCATLLCPLLQNLTGGVGGDVTTKLAPLMMQYTGAGVAWADKLVETIETTQNINNLVTVIKGVSVPNITAKLAVILNAVNDCTKMGYTINYVLPGNITAVLIPILNNVSNPARLGDLINYMESPTEYTAIGAANFVGTSQTWGVPTKAAPHGTGGAGGAGGAISVTIAGGVASAFSAITPGSGYLPDLTYTNVFAGCTTQPTLHLALVSGALSATATNHKVANPGAGCTDGTYALTLTNGTAGAGGALSVTIAGGIATGFSGLVAGAGYHGYVTYSNTFAACTTQPVLQINQTAGALTGGTVVAAGAGCTNGTFPLTIVDPIKTTGMMRLTAMINKVTNYYQMLGLVDSVSNMDKLVLLVQDGQQSTDLVDMLNNMAPTTAGTGACTGVITVTNGTVTTAASLQGFVVAGNLAYIAVTNPTANTYTVAPTTVQDAGCPAFLTAGNTTVVMDSATGTHVTGVYINTLPANSMAELLENISSIANTARLRQVVDGERIFDNTGTQAPAATAGTYLQKMVTLISNLSQPLQGPLKVTQMINGVTNTDKIIDLIYGVTQTSNLSNIINNIFSASILPAVGCSDSATSTFTVAGVANGVMGAAGDLGCNNKNLAILGGNGYVWGDRTHAVDMLVYVLQNISSTANLIAIINGTTPTQVSDLINHVSTGSQTEDTTNTNCVPCAGAAAVTSASNAGGAKLVNILDHAGLNAYDLAFVMNRVGATIKMAKLVNAMPIGQTAAGLPLAAPNNFGTGKIGDLMTRITSTPVAAAGVATQGNCFNQPSATAAQNSVISVNVTGAGAGYTQAPLVSFACDATVTAVATISAGGTITGINITNPGTGGACAASAAATITPALGGASATANVGNCGMTRGLSQAAANNPVINNGKGKLVNMIQYISGADDSDAMIQLALLVNNVTYAQKLGDLVNKLSRSSNVIALVNAVLDTKNNNGGATTNLISVMNNLPVAETHKLVALIQQMAPAIETPIYTLASMDHDLVAKLMAPYATKALPTNTNVTAIANVTGVVTTTAAHGLTVGRQVVLEATGGATMATPLVSGPGQVYYVQSVPSTTTFTVSATNGGAAIATTSAAVLGAGAITLYSYEPTAASGVGAARMNELLGSLTMTNGSNLVAPITVSFGAGCTTVPTATANFTSGMVTNVSFSIEGNCLATPSLSATITPTIAGTGKIGAVFMPNRTGAATDVDLKSVYLTDNGSGYGAAGITFPGCTSGTQPVATAQINGLTSVDITSPGAGCTSNPTVTVTPTGGTAPTAKAYVAGAIAGLNNLNGGPALATYITGQTCPIQGSGGTGGSVAITAAVSPGPITALGAITGGTDYMVNQPVTIGGAARAHALVNAAGTITSYVVDYPGCGYTAATATVVGCTGATPGAVTVAGGQVTAIALGTAGTSCGSNPDVIITGVHGDGATATVASVTGGSLVLVSLSDGADNLAAVLSNQEKAPLGASVNYGSTAPNIGTQEAMVRLLWHGVTYNGGLFPGVGPAHLGYNLMSGLTGTTGISSPVMTVIGMMNSDTTSMADLDTLIGCADKVEFGSNGYPVTATVASNDFKAVCTANAYW